MFEKELKEIFNIFTELEEGKDVEIAKEEICKILEKTFREGKDDASMTYWEQLDDLKEKMLKMQRQINNIIDNVICEI
jgi:lipoate-protein ligase A